MKTLPINTLALAAVFSAVSFSVGLTLLEQLDGCPAGLEQSTGSVEVERICDRHAGVATFESWRRQDKLHREDGPALIERDSVTGVVNNEKWWLNGTRHNKPQPDFLLAPHP